MARRVSGRTGESRPELGSGINVTDPEFLSQARLLAEAESLAHAQKKKKSSETTEKFTKYAKFAVLFWAIRAGIVACGFGAGGVTGFMLWIMSIVTGDGNGLQTVPTWTFEDALRKLPAPKILQRGLPLAVTGVPVAAGHKMYALLAKFPFSPIQYSTDSQVFTYEAAEARGWTVECAAAYEDSRQSTAEPNALSTEQTSTAAADSATTGTRRVPAEMLSSFPFNFNFKSKNKGTNKANVDKDRYKESEMDVEGGKILATLHGAKVHSRGHWYASERMLGGLHSPLVQGLAPDLVSFLGHASMPISQPAQVNLWAGSDGVTCAPHYDTEDNFFLQLRGTKRFVITEPAAHDLFQPYSSLHPKWRQARKAALLAPHDLKQAHLRLRLAAQSRNNTQRILTQANAIPDMKKNIKHSHKAMKLPQIWEVTLEAGDMLFLPAYYFHAVTAESSSVSVNAWLRSHAAQVAQRISKEVELPFPQSDLQLGEPLLGWDGQALAPADSTMRLKLRLLARTVKEALHAVATAGSLDTPNKKRSLTALKKVSQVMQIEEDFRKSLRARHGVECDGDIDAEGKEHGRGQGQREEEREECANGVCMNGDKAQCGGDMKGTSSCGIGKLNLEVAEVCTGAEIGFSAEAIGISDRTAVDLAHLLKPIKDTSVKKMLLMDYLDDVFALVAEEYSMNSPYGARAFAESCF